MWKLFLCDYLTILQNVARKEKNQEIYEGFWLLWGIFIKQNIIIAVLRKVNFHSVDICRLNEKSIM